MDVSNAPKIGACCRHKPTKIIFFVGARSKVADGDRLLGIRLWDGESTKAARFFPLSECELADPQDLLIQPFEFSINSKSIKVKPVSEAESIVLVFAHGDRQVGVKIPNSGDEVLDAALSFANAFDGSLVKGAA